MDILRINSVSELPGFADRVHRGIQEETEARFWLQNGKCGVAVLFEMGTLTVGEPALGEHLGL